VPHPRNIITFTAIKIGVASIKTGSPADAAPLADGAGGRTGWFVAMRSPHRITRTAGQSQTFSTFPKAYCPPRPQKAGRMSQGADLTDAVICILCILLSHLHIIVETSAK
jgi:hypothetical protein